MWLLAAAFLLNTKLPILTSGNTHIHMFLSHCWIPHQTFTKINFMHYYHFFQHIYSSCSSHLLLVHTLHNKDHAVFTFPFILPCIVYASNHSSLKRSARQLSPSQEFSDLFELTFCMAKHLQKRPHHDIFILSFTFCCFTTYLEENFSAFNSFK